MSNFIANCLQIIPGTLKDYECLSCYHYRTEPIKPTTQIYKINGVKGCRSSFPDPIAVIVYRMPIPDLRARTTATKGFFHKPKTLSDRLKLVNKKIQYIARLIVDPRFQKSGLATWLLTETLKLQTVPIIETLTPIDFTNKIFQKAGFKLYQTPAPKWYNLLTNSLMTIGLTEQSLSSPLAVHNRIEHLKPPQSEQIEKQIRNFIKHYRHRQNMPTGIDRTAFILSKIPYPQAYLIWHNPKMPL